MSYCGRPIQPGRHGQFLPMHEARELFPNAVDGGGLREAYRNFEEAKEGVGELTAEVHNLKRLHSGLGGLSPLGFETIHVLQSEVDLVTDSGNGVHAKC